MTRVTQTRDAGRTRTVITFTLDDADLARIRPGRLDRALFDDPAESPADVALALERVLRLIEETVEPGLTPEEQLAQAARCGCKGTDDLCACQNQPDAETRRQRKRSPFDRITESQKGKPSKLGELFRSHARHQPNQAKP